MIERFLKAKHWQMFLLTVGVPMVFQFAIMGSMFASIGANKAPNPDFLFSFMSLFAIMMLIFTGVIFGWYWSVAIGLQNVIPEEFKLSTNKFKFFLLFPLVYIFFFLAYFATAFSSGVPNPFVFAIIFPLHLFSMFCMFYCLYFVAKTFKTAELQRKVSFNDYAGEFFLIWFFPIGIWIVQPKINQMVEKEEPSNGIYKTY